MRVRTFTTAILLAATVTACGDDGPEGICVSGDGAEVCAFTSSRDGRGGVSFTGSGLEPGSRVAIESDFTAAEGYPVDDNGDLIEPVAISLSRARDLSFAIIATSANGEPVTGTIEIAEADLGG